MEDTIDGDSTNSSISTKQDPKSNAEKCKEYRQRQKTNAPEKRKAKTNAENVRAHRQRKKLQMQIAQCQTDSVQTSLNFSSSVKLECDNIRSVDLIIDDLTQSNTNNPELAKAPKSNAEKCKEYRKRQKASAPKKKRPKTGAERAKAYREKKKLELKAAAEELLKDCNCGLTAKKLPTEGEEKYCELHKYSVPEIKKPKTGAERARRYREKKKLELELATKEFWKANNCELMTKETEDYLITGDVGKYHKQPNTAELKLKKKKSSAERVKRYRERKKMELRAAAEEFWKNYNCELTAMEIENKLSNESVEKYFEQRKLYAPKIKKAKTGAERAKRYREKKKLELKIAAKEFWKEIGTMMEDDELSTERSAIKANYDTQCDKVYQDKKQELKMCSFDPQLMDQTQPVCIYNANKETPREYAKHFESFDKDFKSKFLDNAYNSNCDESLCANDDNCKEVREQHKSEVPGSDDKFAQEPFHRDVCDIQNRVLLHFFST